MVDVVTARAFAPMIRLLPLAAQFLQPGGVALLLKGENVDEELTQASAEWHMKVERHDSVTDTRGVILRLSEVRRVRSS
jgi:16S rRNA (guanine527-N7)-methyltransferase